MSRMTVMRVVAVTVALSALAACGGGSTGGGSDDGGREPDVIRLVVQLTDSPPLGVYYNLDDKICTAKHPLEAFTAPQVTVSDGAGKVLDVLDGPEQGGEFVAGLGCNVAFTFDAVKRSKIYVVDITGRAGFDSRTTVKDDGTDSQVVSVDA